MYFKLHFFFLVVWLLMQPIFQSHLYCYGCCDTLPGTILDGYQQTGQTAGDLMILADKKGVGIIHRTKISRDSRERHMTRLVTIKKTMIYTTSVQTAEEQLPPASSIDITSYSNCYIMLRLLQLHSIAAFICWHI